MLRALEFTLINNYHCILVDSFIKCKYNLFDLYKSIGFETCSDIYKDTRYQHPEMSQLLVLDIPKILFHLENDLILNEGLRNTEPQFNKNFKRFNKLFLSKVDDSVINEYKKINKVYIYGKGKQKNYINTATIIT